jgi:hypothetical protein
MQQSSSSSKMKGCQLQAALFMTHDLGVFQQYYA